MLSVALGRAAVDAGHRVYFATAAELAAKCHKAALEGRWKTCMRFFAGPKLLIIDELGYLPLPEDGASALFQVINQRYLKSSTILTTNVGIAKAHMFRRTRAGAAETSRVRWCRGGFPVASMFAPRGPEGFEFGAGEVLTPLAAVCALAVLAHDLVEASDHCSGNDVDVLLGGPDLGPLVVVVAAVGQFQ